MARRFRTVTRGGRQVRATLWTHWIETITNLPAIDTAAVINASNAALVALAPFTIVRTRGLFCIRSDQAVADESYAAALGFVVVSAQAIAIGVTAVPTPFIDLGSDYFFVHEMLMGRFEQVTAAGFEANTLTCKHYDSKAMRKVTEDESIIAVISSDSLGSGVTVHHAARMLIKLH